MRTLRFFFFSPSAGAVFFAVFFAALSAVVFAGALDAVDAGALPAVEAGLGAIAEDGFGLKVVVVVVRVIEGTEGRVKCGLYATTMPIGTYI